MTTRNAALLWVTLSLGWPGLAAQDQELPEKYEKWLEEEVGYIISPREKKAFEELSSVAEWESFIEAFWRRRDPDLLTPVNEFKEEHYRRIEFANKNLGRESAVPGWMTERGQMYIILGEPRDRETFMAVPGVYPMELWFYPADREKALPPLYLLFFQEHFAGPYRLFNHLLDQVEDLIPAEPLDPANSRAEAYEFLQTINPALAHASITMRADQAPFTGIADPGVSSLDFQTLLSDIYVSPYRRIDTRWVDAATDARGLVESDYLFNYVPSTGMINVMPGPGGFFFLHFTMEIEPQHMTLAQREGGNDYYTSFEVVGELTARENEEIIYQFTKELPLRLTGTEFREVMARPFAYRDMFPAAEGEYHFRVILKNRARSEYTILEAPVSVRPPLDESPFLGEPVLLYRLPGIESSERSALYRTYQLGSVVLDPNAKRVYAISQPLATYVPTANLASDHRIVLRVTNLDDPARESVSTKTVPAPAAGSPLLETLTLEASIGGRYELTAELLDAGGAVVSSRRAAFDVSPRSDVARPWVMRQSIDGENLAAVSAALGEQHLVRGDAETAKALFTDSLAQDPNLLTPRLMLGRMSLDEDRAMDAIRLLEPARAQHPDNGEVLLALGDAHYRVGNFSRAVELFETAMPLARPGPALLNALGIAHARLGHRERAIELLSRSVELDPAQADIVSLLERLRSPAP